MAMGFSSITKLVLLTAATLLLVHASARNLQQTQTLPLLVGTTDDPTKSEPPTAVNAPLDNQKNFIYGAGIGGAAGVGGFFGMPGGGSGGTGMTMPLPSGTPLLGGTGAFGGLGGAMGFPGALGGVRSGGGVPSSSGDSP